METHLARLISRLPSSFRCMVCCLDASAEYSRRLTDAGIEHANLACPSLVHPGVAAAWLRFERLAAGFRPHIVHSYGFVADVMAGLLRARRSGIRLVTSRRGEDVNWRHQAVRRILNRWTEKVVCVSSETAAFVQRTESAAQPLLEVIPNGVSTRPTFAHPSTTEHDDNQVVRFGTLGTVKPIKGTDLLVDAFMRFPPAARVELIIAGLIDRPWAEDLRDRARHERRIRFVGRSSDPDAFLSGLDVFVLPSRSEGMSNALLEAMALGLPCIATDVGSNRSLLTPAGEAAAGLICTSEPVSLFGALHTMAASPGARARFGVAGAARVHREYTMESMLARYGQLYRSVLGAT